MSYKSKIDSLFDKLVQIRIVVYGILVQFKY